MTSAMFYLSVPFAEIPLSAQSILPQVQNVTHVNNQSVKRPLMVDVTETFLSGETLGNTTENPQHITTTENVQSMLHHVHVQNDIHVNNQSANRPLMVDVTETFLSGETLGNTTENPQHLTTTENVHSMLHQVHVQNDIHVNNQLSKRPLLDDVTETSLSGETLGNTTENPQHLTTTENVQSMLHQVQNDIHVNNQSAKRPLLVDVTETSLSGETLDNQTEKTEQITTTENVTHKILWYNIPNWMGLNDINHCLKTCSYKNCEFVKDVKMIKESSAVVFSLTTRRFGKTPLLQPTERPRDQVWVFFGMESPIYMDRMYGYLHPTWEKSLNWSMNYRVDSDITIPYGYLKSRQRPPERNYAEIFRMKKRFAAWVVSSCHTVSLREKFVEKLKNYGIEIDIYGACGEKLNTDPRKMISEDYKFYLSFENSLCSDYITEKFFGYYPLNTVMVVRGGADYKKLLPHGTYINTADFESFQQFVDYLKYVGSNETIYTEYLKKKDKYDSVAGITLMCPSFCALCRKLNHLETNRKIYESVPKYLETCRTP